MRRLFLAVLLMAVPAAGAERAVTAADPAPLPAATLHLVCWDPEQILPLDLDQLTSEIQAVLQPTGIEIVARRAEGPSLAGELNVVFLSGDRAPGHSKRRAMGLVKRDPNSALWIFTGMVRQTLGLTRRSDFDRPWEERRNYPRALGRVVAHEIVHTLVPDEPHATSGLMQATLGRDFLTASRAPIDRRFAGALARRLSGESAGEPARLAADLPGER